MEHEESDQLPEEAPSDQVVEDDSETSRKDGEENAGVPGAEGANTGNPGSAGEEG